MDFIISSMEIGQAASSAYGSTTASTQSVIQSSQLIFNFLVSLLHGGPKVLVIRHADSQPNTIIWEGTVLKR